MTSEYLFRHSDNELLHWMVALDGKPLASGEVPLDVAPQGKQLIELRTTAAEERRTTLANGSRSATDATTWSAAGHISAAAVASGGKPQRDTPLRAPRHPATDHQRNGFCIELDNKRWQFNRQSGFLSQMWIGDKNNC